MNIKRLIDNPIGWSTVLASISNTGRAHGGTMYKFRALPVTFKSGQCFPMCCVDHMMHCIPLSCNPTAVL